MDTDTRARELVETFLRMINTHDPDLVERFEAEDPGAHRWSP